MSTSEKDVKPGGKSSYGKSALWKSLFGSTIRETVEDIKIISAGLRKSSKDSSSDFGSTK